MNVVIVAHADGMRRSLQALLGSIPHITSVELAEDAASALQAIATCQPELVLLDLYLLGDEIWSALRQIHTLSPASRRIVLADDVAQQEELQAPAAEAVLLKGALPAELVTTVERLLPPPGAPRLAESCDFTQQFKEGEHE